MSKGKGGLLVLVALVAIVAVIAMIYRTTTNKEMPEDEWFDFEHPTQA